MSVETKPKLSVLPGFHTSFFDLNVSGGDEYLNVYREYVQKIAEHASNAIYARQVLPEKLNDVSYGLPAVEALKSLENGWDGYGSPRPSDSVIKRAGDVWDYITGLGWAGIGAPRVTPSSSGNVTFSWKRDNIELELWIRDEDEFLADWCVAKEGDPVQSGEATKIDEVSTAVSALLVVC